MTYLRPVDMFFSQHSINNMFGRRSRHHYMFIGETLDDICEERCSVNNIPTISVAKVDGRWVTADNRRLWVFRQLYRLNKCDTVSVHVTDSIPPRKMTSHNKGVSILVRRDPGGRWHRKRSVRSDTPTLPTTRPFTDMWIGTNIETNPTPLYKDATYGIPVSIVRTLNTSRGDRATYRSQQKSIESQQKSIETQLIHMSSVAKCSMQGTVGHTASRDDESTDIIQRSGRGIQPIPMSRLLTQRKLETVKRTHGTFRANESTYRIQQSGTKSVSRLPTYIRPITINRTYRTSRADELTDRIQRNETEIKPTPLSGGSTYSRPKIIEPKYEMYRGDVSTAMLQRSRTEDVFLFIFVFTNIICMHMLCIIYPELCICLLLICTLSVVCAHL